MIYPYNVCTQYLDMVESIEKGDKYGAVKAGILCEVTLQGSSWGETSRTMKEVYDWNKYTVTVPEEVESAINGNMATLTYDNLEEWAERLLDRFKQVFEEGVMFNYPAASLILELRKSGFCTREFLTNMRGYMFVYNQPLQYVKTILTYKPKSDIKGIELFVESPNYRKPKRIMGRVPFEDSLLVEGFTDNDMVALKAWADEFPAETKPSTALHRWILAMQAGIDDCMAEGWNYALMSGLKTILTMAGAEDLSENDIPALWSKARGAKLVRPIERYIYITSQARELVEKVCNGSNVKVGDRQKLWHWLNQLSKQVTGRDV